MIGDDLESYRLLLERSLRPHLSDAFEFQAVPRGLYDEGKQLRASFQVMRRKMAPLIMGDAHNAIHLKKSRLAA